MPVKDKKVKYPNFAYATAVLGMFLGASFVGFSRWEGYILGLPFLMIGNIIHALITGKVVYPVGTYSSLRSSTRKEDPLRYWFSILIFAFISYWIILKFNEIN